MKCLLVQVKRVLLNCNLFIFCLKGGIVYENERDIADICRINTTNI